MASVITHSISAVLFGKILTSRILSKRFWVFVGICSMLPDVDVIGFKYGIPYDSFWGHRGFTHSFLFAFILGLLSSACYIKSLNIMKIKFWIWAMFFFVVTSTHTILDAMTDGGHGVAMLSPFDDTRHFFSWRPLKVSPIGAKRFFSQRGIDILKNEFTYVILPILLILSSKKIYVLVNRK